MRRWMMLAACVAMTAACQDRDQPLSPRVPAAPRAALLAGARVDPVLASLLATASPGETLEVLVSFDETTTTAALLGSAIRRTGAGVLTFRHLATAGAVATPAQIAAVRALPGVQSVYANRQLRYLLRESTQSIGADLVWADGFTGRGVGIAILDSGVDGQYHPGLAYPTKTVANVKYAAAMRDLALYDDTTPGVGGRLFVENVPTSETSVGHGTHVAGIAAGDGGGSAAGSYRGVAPGAHVVGIGVGDVLWAFWTLAGLDWVLENRERYNIQVLNNSWGGSGAWDPSDPVSRATRKLHDAGVAVVFAAGNEGPGDNTLNPHSAAPWVISVAAGCKLYVSDPTGSAADCADAAGRAPVLGDFSSRGIPGDTLYHPDITAPGVRIVSARAATGLVLNSTDLLSDAQSCNISLQHVDHYTCASGTSMAAPHIAGVIALMEEASGGRLTPAQALRLLTRTARPLAGYGAWEVGAGFVDARAAVRAARTLRR